jgi:MFS family permease
MTPQFAHLLKARELVPSPLNELFRTQWINILLGALAPLASYALFHLVTIFPLSWGLLFPGQSPVHLLIVQIAGAAISMLTMAASGKIADRVGRRRTLALGAVMIALFSGLTPFLLTGHAIGGALFILIGFALLGFSHAQSAGAVNSSFLPRFRYSGAVYTSDLGWLLGAGFAPLVALELAAHLGAGYVGLYLLSGALASIAALRISRHRETMRDD